MVWADDVKPNEPAWSIGAVSTRFNTSLLLHCIEVLVRPLLTYKPYTPSLTASIFAMILAHRTCSSPQDTALSPAHSPRCPVANGPVLMAELFGTARASLEKVQLSGPQARAAATRVS